MESEEMLRRHRRSLKTRRGKARPSKDLANTCGQGLQNPASVQEKTWLPSARKRLGTKMEKSFASCSSSGASITGSLLPSDPPAERDAGRSSSEAQLKI